MATSKSYGQSSYALAAQKDAETAAAKAAAKAKTKTVSQSAYALEEQKKAQAQAATSKNAISALAKTISSTDSAINANSAKQEQLSQNRATIVANQAKAQAEKVKNTLITGSNPYAQEKAQEAYASAVANQTTKYIPTALQNTLTAASRVPTTQGIISTIKNGGDGDGGSSSDVGGGIPTTVTDLANAYASNYGAGWFTNYGNYADYDVYKNIYTKAIDEASEEMKASQKEQTDNQERQFSDLAAQALANYMANLRKSRASAVTSGASRGAQASSELQQATELGNTLAENTNTAYDNTVGKYTDALITLLNTKANVGKSYTDNTTEYAANSAYGREGDAYTAAATKYAADKDYAAAQLTAAAQNAYYNAQSDYYTNLANGTISSGSNNGNSSDVDYSLVKAALKGDSYGYTDDEVNTVLGLMQAGMEFEDATDVVNTTRKKTEIENNKNNVANKITDTASNLVYNASDGLYYDVQAGNIYDANGNFVKKLATHN